jgi:hypothetical protein
MAAHRSYGHSRRDRSGETLARGLGWFSIAVGLAELLAPRALCQALGMRGQERLVQAFGVREIGTGIAILAARDPTPWIYGRIGGDTLDLATLATGLEGDNPRQGNVGLALAAVAGATALDILCARRLSQAEEFGGRPHDYSDRSGFPKGPDAMRGAARGDAARSSAHMAQADAARM